MSNGVLIFNRIAMNNRLIATLIFFSLFSSCDDDFFSTTLEIDPPEFEDLLAVNLFAGNFQNEVQCRIGKTIPVLENKDLEESMVNNASVELFHDSKLICSLHNDSNRDEINNFFGNLSEDLIAGESYDLKVESALYGPITASQIMPSMVDIDTIRLRENAGLDSYGEKVSSIEVRISDPSLIQNFYSMNLLVSDTIQGWFYDINIWSDDPQIVDGFMYDGLMTSDVGFNGHNYTFKIFFSPHDFQQVKDIGYLSWTALSKDHYLYSTSLQRWYDGQDFQGFSEPTIVHSNIKGGIGCFGLFNTDFIPLPR
jgi:hypothetical protein